jgi:transposase
LIIRRDAVNALINNPREKWGCLPVIAKYVRNLRRKALIPIWISKISDALPKANTLLGDRGYDADWSQGALTAKGIAPCIPSKTNRKIPIPHNPILYPQRHKIENMFGPLKDGRRIQTRYDQCAQTSMSASPSDPTIIA